MANNVIKTRGATKSSQATAGGANLYPVPVLGIVKNNIDSTRTGSIQVFIGTISGTKDPNDYRSWTTVRYLSTYFGRVTPTAGQTGLGTYVANPSSYGQWQSPPDIGTTVLCVFVNGDSGAGFYLGGVPEATALQMVPAIGAADNVLFNSPEANTYGGATRLPVTNINTNNKDNADSTEYNNTARPVHSYSAGIMFQQGIIRDPVRGPISSSASREPASRVGWGVSTPGRPIYDGGYTDETLVKNLDPGKAQNLKVIARRGGHSMVMDDGDIIGRDQLIRIRTALGHQILMSDDGQTLMILHSNGQSYIELGKEGTVDVYSTNSVNVRTQGDLNLHADQNVNIHAGEKLNIQAKNIQVNSEEAFQLRAGKSINAYALEDITAVATKGLSLAAGSEASMAAAGAAFVNGEKVNLNTGKTSVEAPLVPVIPINAQTDTLFDKEKGFLAAPAKLLSIASRTPAHAPWANAGQGVDVKTDLNASSQLPQAPSAAVAQTNEQAAQMGEKPPEQATVASVPSTAPSSGAVDSGVTPAVMASVATSAATGAAASAVKTGASVVADATGGSCVAGAYAMTASQMSDGGALKPGSATLINAMGQKTGNITQSYPSSVFTGAAGAKSITNFAQNVNAQTGTMNNLMQKSQTALTVSGVISGREAPGMVAGLVTSSAVVGIAATRGAISQLSGASSSTVGSVAGLTAGKVGSAAGAALNQVGGAIAAGIKGAVGGIGNALKSISSGQAAAGLASKLGGLGGIKGALEASGPNLTSQLDAAKGISGSAFSAIKASFKPFKAGVPQNLTQISKATAAAAATTASTVPSTKSSLLAGASNLIKTGASIGAGVGGSLLGAAKGASSTLGSSINAADSVSGVTGQLKNATSKISSVSNSRTSTTGSVGATFAAVNNTTGSSSAKNITDLVGKTSGTNEVHQDVTTAINQVGAMSGAASSIASGQLQQLPDSAAVVQAGAGAALSSQLASGVDAIPGGIKTLGSVMNNAPGAINSIPGAGQLSGALSGNLGAAAMSKAGGLAALAKSGLSSSAAASLESTLASLSGGSPGTLKLPTMGVNTVDRGDITAQTTAVLDDPKIPPPNLVGEIKEETKESYQAQLDQIAQEKSNAEAKITAAKDSSSSAASAYRNALDTLPAGDPQIAAAKAKYDASSNSLSAAFANNGGLT